MSNGEHITAPRVGWGLNKCLSNPFLIRLNVSNLDPISSRLELSPTQDRAGPRRTFGSGTGSVFFFLFFVRSGIPEMIVFVLLVTGNVLKEFVTFVTFKNCLILLFW